MEVEVQLQGYFPSSVPVRLPLHTNPSSRMGSPVWKPVLRSAASGRVYERFQAGMSQFLPAFGLH